MNRHPSLAQRWVSLLAIIAFSSFPLGATSLRMVNLADMVGHSERIFSGICQAVSSGLDENNMPYTSYSFRVTDSIHGIANQQVVVVKQFGLAEPIQLDNGMTQVTRIEGMPRYVPGQEYLLLLNQESSLGFSSPIGLVQGAFLVQGTGTSRTVVNGMGNANLLVDTSKAIQQRPQGTQQNLSRTTPMILDEVVKGPVSYDNFTSLVKNLLVGEPLDTAAASRLLGRREER